MKNKNFFYLKKCRCCGSKKLKKVLNLGKQPLANNLLNNKKEKFNYYPLEIKYCLNCHNCQLSVCIKPSILFDKYLYLSSVSNTFRKHFDTASRKYINTLKLKKNSFIIDIGSNDGVGLMPFKKKGFKNILGIEPAKNLAKISQKKGIKTYNSYFDKNVTEKIKNKADLILASNVFAHSNNLKTMAKHMLDLLSSKGSIVIEVQYLLRTIKDLTFDNIYHEHYNYWSLTSLNYFFSNLNAKIYKAETIDTHGGSIRIYITKNKRVYVEKNVKKILNKESNFGLKSFNRYKKFSEDVKKIKQNVSRNIKKILKKYKKVIFYGAPAKATTSLNFYGIKNKEMIIIEDNKLKQGKILPGVQIPIYSKDILNRDKEELIVVLAWNFIREIKEKNKSLSNKFLSIKKLEEENLKI